jgi:hypothetical protein
MDQLGNTVLALLNNPGQWRQLRDDPGLVRLAASSPWSSSAGRTT